MKQAAYNRVGILLVLVVSQTKGPKPLVADVASCLTAVQAVTAIQTRAADLAKSEVCNATQDKLSRRKWYTISLPQQIRHNLLQWQIQRLQIILIVAVQVTSNLQVISLAQCATMKPRVSSNCCI